MLKEPKRQGGLPDEKKLALELLGLAISYLFDLSLLFLYPSMEYLSSSVSIIVIFASHFSIQSHYSYMAAFSLILSTLIRERSLNIFVYANQLITFCESRSKITFLSLWRRS